MDVKEAVKKGALELASLINVPPNSFLREEVESIREGGAAYRSVTFS